MSVIEKFVIDLTCNSATWEIWALEEREQIIAALRAGDKLADNSLNIYEAVKEAEYFQWAEEFKQAALAWDAATKESE